MIDQNYLKECFSYDDESGLLRWRERPRHHFASERGMKVFLMQFALKEAGCDRKSRSGLIYKAVRLNKKLYCLHRLVWIYVYGFNPNTIDHIDGNGLNNKISNLRNVTAKKNCRNRRVQSNNKTGIAGVHYRKRINKFRAQIGRECTQIGDYDNFLDACCARISAENNLGYVSRR